MPGSLEREVPMFSVEEIQSIDKKYFNIIAVNEYDVTIMSRNTGHFWYLHNPEYPERGTVILFHRHNGCLPTIFSGVRTVCGLRCDISGSMTGIR